MVLPFLLASCAVAKVATSDFQTKAEEFNIKTEMHEISTSDGYIVQLGRLLADSTGYAEPVLIMPDLFMTMDSWFVHAHRAFNEQSLPIMF
jgi:hypothetical protein